MIKARALLLLTGIAAAGCGGSHGSNDGGDDTSSGTPNLRSVSLATNAIIYDAKRFRILASLSTPASASSSVVALDPATGKTGTTLEVGSGPNALALSDDGSTLYVGLDGEQAFRRVDLATNRAGSSTTIQPIGGVDRPYASNIEVQPGSTSTVAVYVAQRQGSATYGPIVYDDGVARPNSDFYGRASEFVWDGERRIVGVNAVTTSAYVSDFAVDASGLTLTSTGNKGVTGASTFQKVGDRFYTTDGTVLDRTSLNVLGRFPITQQNVAYGPAVDATHNRAYFLELEGTTATRLRVFDLQTFAETTQTVLPSIGSTDIVQQPGRSNLLLCGSRRLALRTPERVFFIDDIPQD